MYERFYSWRRRFVYFYLNSFLNWVSCKRPADCSHCLVCQDAQIQQNLLKFTLSVVVQQSVAFQSASAWTSSCTITLWHHWILLDPMWDLFKQLHSFFFCSRLSTKYISQASFHSSWLQLLCARMCACDVSLHGSYIYAMEGDSTAVFQLANLSIAQNTKQEKQYIILTIILLFLYPFSAIFCWFSYSCLSLIILDIGLRLHEIKKAYIDNKVFIKVGGFRLKNK